MAQCRLHWARADVTIISQTDYRRAGSPCLDASTKKLVGVNDSTGQFQRTGGAVVDEDIYVLQWPAKVTSESEGMRDSEHSQTSGGRDSRLLSRGL